MLHKQVLVTGAFGNIGSLVVKELLARGYRVRAFDKKNPSTVKNSKQYGFEAGQVFWGDITRPADVAAAMDGIDEVIHLVGIFPPLSEDNPALATAVNVDGTRHVIAAMEASTTARRLVFASSIAVYGMDQSANRGPLNASDPVKPDDHYGATKADCENLIRQSSLDWTLMRISGCPPIDIRHMASFKKAPFLECHPDARVEIVHPADTALAFVNAIDCQEAIGKTLLLGGGAKNRNTCHQLFNTLFAVLGLKPLPREAFHITDTIVFHGDWLDTEESQRLLKFQRYDAEALFIDFRESLGFARIVLPVLPVLAPLVRWSILRASPYYRKQVQASIK